jgi:shikimate kinase
MTSIVLVGPRCVGKSETGQILSGIWSLPFIDADRVFERTYGPVKRFVRKNGWPKFRMRESKILSEIFTGYSHNGVVLAPGGGAVAHDQGETYRAQNAELLKDFGNIVYLLPTESLEESARILTARMANDTRSTGQRPSLTQAGTQYEEMLQTLRKRDPLYREAAHHVFYTRDFNPAQVAWCITDLVR